MLSEGHHKNEDGPTAFGRQMMTNGITSDASGSGRSMVGSESAAAVVKTAGELGRAMRGLRG